MYSKKSIYNEEMLDLALKAYETAYKLDPLKPFLFEI